MRSNSMVNRILLASSALALALLMACNGSGQTSIQPQPQSKAYPVLVNPFGQLVLDQSRPAIGAQFAPLGGRTPAPGQKSAEAQLNRLLNPPKR